MNIIHLLTGMRIIATLLFPETPTIARRETKGISWCQRGTINLILPRYPFNKGFIIPNSIRRYNIMDRTEPTRHVIFPKKQTL